MADGYAWDDNPALREEAEKQIDAWKQSRRNGHTNSDGFTAEPPDPAECSVAAWLKREIPEPDILLGPFSTTSRGLLSADTGLGKTNFCLALAHEMVEGRGFLHWLARRKASALYIEGEMSKRLVRVRAIDAVRRLGSTPDGLYILSADDHPFPPLNTEAGQQYIDSFIEKIGRLDFIFFDNVQALTLGPMAEEGPWEQMLPWIGTLTRRSIGQLWIHHTGHDTTRGYGTKTREWQMDMVMVGEAVERAGTDIAFNLRFSKARERDPCNRENYATVTVILQNDEWNSDGDGIGPKSGAKPPPPLARKFYDALLNAIVVAAEGNKQSRHGHPAATRNEWFTECVKLGLLDRGDKRTEGNSRALFSKYRRELIAAEWIVCEGDLSWSIRQKA